MVAISTAVDASALARVVGIQTNYVNLRGGNTVNLPQRIAVLGQGSTVSTYALTKQTLTSVDAVGSAFGYGSPLHLAARQLTPANGDGVGIIPVTYYPLVDNGSGVAATGDIEATVTTAKAASYQIKVNNMLSQAFTVAVGDVAADVHTAIKAALDASPNLPLTADTITTTVPVETKWAGISSNDVYMEVIGPTDKGVTFAVTQVSGGLVNPNAAELNAALAQVGPVWETLFLNCLDIADTTALTEYTTFGEGRWGSLVNKPCLFFTGNLNTTVAAAIAVPDARKTDRTNCQFVAPGSKDLPFVSAARQLARLAVMANKTPSHDYGSQRATGLTPGLDSEQWEQPDKDQAFKAGSSTIEVLDGVIQLSDTATFYHPTGEETPPYRFVVDNIKLWQVLFNLDLEFATTEWDGAPLVPDGQPVSEPTAKSPSDAVAAVAGILDGLGRAAIISDPATAKASILAGINESNPKRLDISFTIQLAGNVNIISITNNFGFFFGVVEAA